MDFLSAYDKIKEKLAVTSEAVGANFPYTTTNGKYDEYTAFILGCLIMKYRFGNEIYLINMKGYTYRYEFK